MKFTAKKVITSVMLKCTVKKVTTSIRFKQQAELLA